MDATAELFKRQGYNGTGVKQIVADASAPFASLYHFFPGGKEELGAEVIRWSGAMYGLLWLEIVRPEADIAKGVRKFFVGAAEHLAETDYADACPIATVALEVASTSEPLRQATADVFDLWLTGARDDFMQAGITRKKAHELALTFVSLLEGAFILSRAKRTTEPVLVAGKVAEATVRAAMVSRRSRG